MTDYEVTDLPMASCMSAASDLLSLLSALSPEFDRFCVEAHFKTLLAMKTLATHIPSPRFAMYCWRELNDITQWNREEFQYLGKGRVVFGNREIYIETDPPMPPYDWDGKASISAHITYTEREPKLSEHGRSGPSENTKSILQRIIETATRKPARVHVCDSASDETRVYSYSSPVAISEIIPVVQAICDSLVLSHGVGSFEFLGTASQIEALATGAYYLLSDFPPGCWSFNGSAGKTPFALARDSFSHPILNITKETLKDVAGSIDRLTTDLTRTSIIRKYLSWNLGSERLSPKCQGNYALISRQRQGYAMFFGFEQYADQDPTVKQYLTTITPVVKQFGGTLKRVQFIR